MFIMVLMLVAAVALLVLPMMLVSTTGLRGTNRSEQRFTDRYASDAGIKHALWNIKYGGAFLDGVPYTKTVNDLPTEITIRSGDPDPPTDVPMLKLVGGPAMQRFADETGLTITVGHLPPGTSKWNKIEHRLFSFITQNWRGQPLVSHEVIVSLIGGTRNTKGLRVECHLDTNKYPAGIKVSDSELAQVNLRCHVERQDCRAH